MTKTLIKIFQYVICNNINRLEGNLMEKTRQLLAYLIEHHPETSITGLMKLAYISDLVSIKKTNKQISDFEYTRYKYGPFDKRIYDCVNDLIYSGLVIEGRAYTTKGDEYIVYKCIDEVDFEYDKLEDTEKNVINEVIQSLCGYGARALVDLAYLTEPMKKIGATQENDVGLNETLDLWAS